MKGVEMENEIRGEIKKYLNSDRNVDEFVKKIVDEININRKKNIELTFEQVSKINRIPVDLVQKIFTHYIKY